MTDSSIRKRLKLISLLDKVNGQSGLSEPEIMLIETAECFKDAAADCEASQADTSPEPQCLHRLGLLLVQRGINFGKT